MQTVTVTETTHYGNFHSVVSGTAYTLTEALGETLSRSPYYAYRYEQLGKTLIRQIVTEIIENGISYFGWATYTFRIDE